jgi:pimeloyl-ACP methyl ester carboxylesterase
MQRLRLLCLHGYHGNKQILRQQMDPLFDGLEVDCVQVDAPSIAEGDFGWWHGNFTSYREGFRGWQRTRDWLVQVFAGEPRFDGVFGFSQGAALVGLLPGMRAPDGRPTEATPLSFDFAIAVGGFRSRAPEHEPLFAARAGYQLPSLHIMGTSDRIVPAADSRVLAERFTSPVVLEHAGGHIIPGIPSIRAKLTDFLREMADRRDSAQFTGQELK